MIELHFDDIYGGLVLINLYFPNGGGGAERLAYKLAFYDAFLAHIDTLRKLGKKIVFCGDVNTAHTEIDPLVQKKMRRTPGSFQKNVHGSMKLSIMGMLIPSDIYIREK